MDTGRRGRGGGGGGSNNRLIKCGRDSNLCMISNGFEAVENVVLKMKQIACAKTRKFCATVKKAPQFLIFILHILHNKIRKRSVDPIK